MPIFEPIVEILENISNALGNADIATLASDASQLPTFYIIAGTVIFVGMTIFAGWLENNLLGIGLTGLVLVFAITYAQELDGLNASFYLSMTTEIIGAVMIFVLFQGFFVPGLHLATTIAFCIAIFLTLIPVTTSTGIEQEFWLNLTTEMVGSLIIFFLVQGAMEGDFNFTRTYRKLSFQEFRARKRAEKYLVHRARRITAIESETSIKKLEFSDTFIYISGKTKEDVEEKIGKLKLNVQNFIVDFDEYEGKSHCVLVPR